MIDVNSEAGASEGSIAVAGSIATRRRTVTGVIGQAGLMGLDDTILAAILRTAGLPGRALDDPDFPISVDQELVALALMLEHLRERQRSIVLFALQTFARVGINHYGVLGLAMQHAPSVREALRTILAFPELAWGHCRIAGRRSAEAFALEFELGVEIPDGLDVVALREYCVTTDLTSVQRMIADVAGPAHGPVRIELPFTEPIDAHPALDALPCPVHFDAPTATVHYRSNIVDAVPVLSAALPFRRYRKLSEAISRMLAEDVSIEEQVMRLLWAYVPAPDRGQVAEMLGMSTRTLARRLAASGTSFADLLRTVRIERATNFLRDGSLPIAVIAERMGYSDPAAFTRAFQGWTGEAPSRWRRRARVGA